LYETGFQTLVLLKGKLEMEHTKIVILQKLNKRYIPDITCFCVGQKTIRKPDILPKIQHQNLLKAVNLGDFKGDENDVLLIYGGEEQESPGSKRTAFIGFGKVTKKTKSDELREKMRVAGGNIAALCKKVKADKVCITLPELPSIKAMQDAVYCLTEGVLLGDYSFQKYKTESTEKKSYQGIKELHIVVPRQLKTLQQEAELAQVVAFSTCHARDMANEPGNSWTPTSFADYAAELAEKYHMKCTVFDKKQLQKMKMGGILAVNKGSETPPKLVVLEYTSSEKDKTLLLVGKGLTFDSGGVSLKPSSGMEDMKYDMCGGAAVLAAMNAVGFLKPHCNVIAIVPATDNMPGGSALKPGDIIFHYNNKTSEIINTDAEGRLILADALAYGIEKYSPDYVIDLATLTGAVIIGLGHHHSGLFSNNDHLAGRLMEAGRKCGEPLWRLPLGPDYKKQLDSKVADLKNTGGKPGGAITAAEYLHAFVGKTAWAHLDIAGTAWSFSEKTYIPQGGPSGIGVRTLVDFIREMTKKGGE
jgi:leucyl aminopeptidase